MANAIFNLALPDNEEVKSYAPGSPERELLKAKLAEMENQQVDIPLIIGGKEIRTGNTGNIVAPHNHKKIAALSCHSITDQILYASIAESIAMRISFSPAL